MTTNSGPPYSSYRRRRSLRLLGHDYSEPYAYHIIWGTHRAIPALVDEIAACVANVIEATAPRARAEVLAYCVMPDHVHMLLVPAVGGDVIRFVQQVKSLAAREYLARGGSGRLWQRGFYDHMARHEEDVAAMARYIVGNPVRAGMVEDSSAYPFARIFTSDAGVPSS